MVTVVTREANGIPLTHDQVDSNFTNLADAVNNIGDDILGPAIAAKDAAVSAANSANLSSQSATNSANAASISRGNAATFAEQSAASAAESASYVNGLSANDGASRVGANDGASGSIFTTIAGFITKIMSSAGASIIGFIQIGTGAVFRTLLDKVREIHVSPKDFGAVGDGINIDRLALQKAINKIRSVGGGVLDLGNGDLSYLIDQPLKLYSNMRITGRAYIIASSGFSSTVSFPTYGTEVPQIYNCMAYFNDGTHADDPTNFGYGGLEIDRGVQFLGNYHCDNGLIMEGITNYRISGNFGKFNVQGVYAKYYCWGGTINPYISDCVVCLLKLGEASNGISLRGLRAFGNSNTPTYGIQVVGDNNGIDLAGAFVEKMINGVYWQAGSGPATIHGVDFEDCFGDLITVDGTGVLGRAAGPITISGSFLEATNIAVKCINAVAIVSGCRVRDTPLAFSTSGDMSRIYDINNQFEGSVTRSNGGNIISDIVNPNSREQTNYLPNGAVTPVDSYSIENNSYSPNPNVAVNLLSFSSFVADMPTQRMLSSSIWETREMRTGSVFGVMGLKLDYSTGAKQVLPRGDNDHNFGSASLKIAAIFLGTAPIVSSDENVKDQIVNIDSAVLRAWGKVEFFQYKFRDAIEIKGDGARWHIGVIAQRVKEAFESEGLDPFAYGVLCYDEWSAVNELLRDDGTIAVPASASGSRYGIRYEEALALECAYLRSKL